MSKKITIRVSPEEYELFRSEAQKAAVTQSDYFRQIWKENVDLLGDTYRYAEQSSTLMEQQTSDISNINTRLADLEKLTKKIRAAAQETERMLSVLYRTLNSLMIHQGLDQGQRPDDLSFASDNPNSVILFYENRWDEEAQARNARYRQTNLKARKE